MTSPPTQNTPASGGLTVRHCHGLEEFREGFALMQQVWGKTDIDVPVPLFVVAAETGGQVLGAFEGSKMVGFTMALAAYRDSRPFLHSHMTAVLESHRDRGVGRQLKLLQRRDALDRGITLVEWTFDPLEVKNAYFNFMRLGAVARRYIPNCYGVTSSPLHGGLPTDRLVAEWYLDSPRVKELVEEGASPAAPAASASDAQIVVPADLPHLRQHKSSEALRIQTEVRGQFQNWFAKSYEAVAMEISPAGGRYILRPQQNNEAARK
jgi:predicted GNAT superfamily acetyltransferase